MEIVKDKVEDQGNYKIELFPVALLVPSSKNPKGKISFKRFIKNIRKVPMLLDINPCIVSDRANKFTILDGNYRYYAALELLHTQIPVIVMKGLTEEQEKAITYNNNKKYSNKDFDIIVDEWFNYNSD